MPPPPAIKSAFRRLAKKLHPDANKADKTGLRRSSRAERGL
jgi:curved DNA-binding protein CbpA